MPSFKVEFKKNLLDETSDITQDPTVFDWNPAKQTLAPLSGTPSYESYRHQRYSRILLHEHKKFNVLH